MKKKASAPRKKKQVSFMVPMKFYDSLSECSRDTGVPIGDIVNVIVWLYLKIARPGGSP